MKAIQSGGERILTAVLVLIGLLALSPAARASVTASPSSLNFGSVAVGDTKAVGVTLTNRSSRPLDINGAQLSSSEFSYMGAASFSIGRWSSVTVRVAFKPTASQSYNATLTLGSRWSHVTISLTGTGVSVQTSTSSPTITSQPTSPTVMAGQAASFSVAVSGASPFRYQWMKNGRAIRRAHSSSYTTPVTTSSDNGAQFTVSVSNSAGNATSNAATLTVDAGSVAPAITSQPASRTVTAGQTASFSVTVSGTSPFSYQWIKNGAAISGATSSIYATPATTTADNNAQFTVRVSNSAGNATSNAATLTVDAGLVAPAITSQPASRTVTAGQTASFSVAVSGTSPFSYQWIKNGAAISGATSSTYTTPTTTTADNNAQFAVRVSNSAGNVTSSAATLTVNAGSLLLSLNPTTLNFGNVNTTSSASKSVTVTNAGGTNITISGVSYSGPGFSTSGLSSGLILAPGQTATMDVTFTPAGSGSVTGSVTVASNATNSPSNVSLSGSGVVSHRVLLSWIPSATSSIAGYQVYSSTVSGGPYTKLTTSAVAGTDFTDSSVQNGGTYYYVVTAVNSKAQESSYSTQVSAVIP
jgi:HYDIN/CFA65/VesB-like, Ig-like domain/Cep192 domain 4/Immunoglobulin domain/Immunoglobulin I-set domain